MRHLRRSSSGLPEISLAENHNGCLALRAFLGFCPEAFPAVFSGALLRHPVRTDKHVTLVEVGYSCCTVRQADEAPFGKATRGGLSGPVYQSTEDCYCLGTSFFPYHPKRGKKYKTALSWETDFYTPPVLGGAALFDNSAAAVYKNPVP